MQTTVEALRGAVAGTIGTVAMDLVTWPMYRREDPRAWRREKQAQVHGKWAAHAAAEDAAIELGWKPSPRALFVAGEAVHLMMGVGPAVLYALLRRRYPGVTAGKGMLFGTAVFLLADELLTPLTGAASGPRAYPWQAHFRGLVGHLLFGIATEAALDVLHWERDKWRSLEA